MNKKQDTGFGVSIDVIRINGVATRIVNEWNEKELVV